MTEPKGSFRATKKEEGVRLDLFLKDKLLTVSRKKIKGLLDQGRILVSDRKVVIASWQLQGNDIVKILPEGT
ncbi:MAG: S4 domain-containing protein, partial [bacterium]|nr:S4 domain-containing protein [bacterium]